MRVQVIAACLVCDLSLHVYALFARYYQVWCMKCICVYACVYTRVGDRILQRRVRNDEYVETLFPDARAHAFGRRYVFAFRTRPSVLCRDQSVLPPRVPPDHALSSRLFNPSLIFVRHCRESVPRSSHWQPSLLSEYIRSRY